MEGPTHPTSLGKSNRLGKSTSVFVSVFSPVFVAVFSRVFVSVFVTDMCGDTIHQSLLRIGKRTSVFVLVSVFVSVVVPLFEFVW